MTTKHSDTGHRDNRRFAVSANRDLARHRIRYVEAGGASVDVDECTFCQHNPELDWKLERRADRTLSGSTDDH